MATDYDCWHEGEEHVTVEAVIATLRANVDRAKRLIREAVPRINALPSSPCWTALQGAIMTSPENITPEARKRLVLLLEGLVEDQA